MPAHTSRGDELAISVVFQLVTTQIRAFALLPFPMLRGRSRTVENGVDVRSDDFPVMIDRPVRYGSLSPWDPGICNEDVETTVEFSDNLVDGIFDVFWVGHVDSICLAWSIISATTSLETQSSCRKQMRRNVHLTP
jgi:hypothetical protein